MIEDLLIPLIVVGLAELGDKTQLSVILLSSKTKKHLELLIGVMLAFLIVDGIAILAGEWITTVVPEEIVKLAAGIIFIIFGILILMNSKDGAETKFYSKSPLVMGFTLIFLTEWGDKTQIASALLATQYDAWMVLAGVMAALTAISAMAIWLGKFVSEKIHPKLITKIAGILFILLGIIVLLG